LGAIIAVRAHEQPSALSVSSPALADNGMLAKANAASERNCGGENVSPPVGWSDAPAGTRSFAIVMTDPDGGRGLGSVHWIAYGVAPTVTSLPEGGGRCTLANLDERREQLRWHDLPRPLFARGKSAAPLCDRRLCARSRTGCVQAG